MAYIFQSIAATQFLSQLLLNVQVSNGYYIATFSEKSQKSHKYGDGAISSEFLTHRVVQEYPMQRGKISIFATFGGHLGF